MIIWILFNNVIATDMVVLQGRATESVWYGRHRIRWCSVAQTCQRHGLVAARKPRRVSLAVTGLPACRVTFRVLLGTCYHAFLAGRCLGPQVAEPRRALWQPLFARGLCPTVLWAGEGYPPGVRRPGPRPGIAPLPGCLWPPAEVSTAPGRGAPTPQARSARLSTRPVSSPQVASGIARGASGPKKEGGYYAEHWVGRRSQRAGHPWQEPA